jgi:branched-chain amino acid transport system ATP-binding protein
MPGRSRNLEVAVREQDGASFQLAPDHDPEGTAPDTVEVDLAAVMGTKGKRRLERQSLTSLLGLNVLNPWRATGGEPVQPLLLLSAMLFFTLLDAQAFGVLTPEIRDYFGLDLTTVTQLNAIGSLITTAVALPIGWLVDRVSRPRLGAIGLGLFASFTFLTGLAPGLLMLAMFRFGAGIGATLEGPVQQPLLADSYSPKVRGTVFAFTGLMANLAGLVAPGFIAIIYGATQMWQAPFLLLSLPALILSLVLFFKLRDPVRGGQERRALGVSDEDVIASEQRPPTFAEAARICWNVRTLRRLWFGIPFITGSFSVVGTLTVTLYDEKFHLGVGSRSLIATLTAPVGMLGLAMGGNQVNRLLRYRPGRVLIVVGALVASISLQFLALALTPWLALAIGLGMLTSFGMAIVSPALAAIMSLVTPPRVRGVSGAIFGLWSIPGSIFGIVAGNMGDRYGISYSMVVMAVVFVIGAAIWASAASGVEPDMRSAMAASMAQLEVERSREEGRAKLLVCRDLDVHYSNVQILFNVDFDVEEGEIIALLGTNGAGKSTLLRAIAGLTSPSNGAIFCDAEDITYLPAHEHAGRGIIMVNGGRGVFPTLTVGENLRIAAWLFRDDEEYVREAMERVFGFFPILRTRLSEPAGNLSGGEQQMLTLSQAFLSKPKLLMIDELSLGLAPAVVGKLLDIVRAIHESGTTVILVEQSVNVALTIARRAVYMEKGEIRFTGPTADLLERNDILHSVFLKGANAAGGLGAGDPYRRPVSTTPGTDAPRETVLVVRDVHKAFGGVQAINGIDLTLEEGTILGIIGPNGAGKTTLFDIISGFITPDHGVIELFGEDITQLGADVRARLGLQRSFQDARLFPALTVAENLAVALERHVEVRSATFAALGLPNVKRSESKIAQRVDRLISQTSLGDYRNKFVGELSTGSRRIVDLACVLAADPKVILLDEPSSGVAQRETEELGPLLSRIRYETGCAMLLIEHDMSLITSVSDELLALDLGRNVTRGLPDEVVEDPRVVASYLGTSQDAINRSGHLS